MVSDEARHVMDKLNQDAFRDFRVSLVLAGGNALGAYHLGAYEALTEAGVAPEWYLGASIGAVTAAILVGNPPSLRMERLERFWSGASQQDFGGSFRSKALPREIRARLNNDHALSALLFGRPGLFRSSFPGAASVLPFMPPTRGIRNQKPLAETLCQLVDFDLLNNAPERLSILAIDVETAEEVWFDNRTDEIRPEHLLAATALAPLFQPVEIDGRLLCDAGVGNNLPFDHVFHDKPVGDNMLCIAVDLFHAAHGRPETLDETVARVQDLTFGIQSQRAIKALARERTLAREIDEGSPSAILCHLAYHAPGHQRALKALDFSRASLDERVHAGRSDMEKMLESLKDAPRTEPLAYLGPMDGLPVDQPALRSQSA